MTAPQPSLSLGPSADIQAQVDAFVDGVSMKMASTFGEGQRRLESLTPLHQQFEISAAMLQERFRLESAPALLVSIHSNVQTPGGISYIVHITPHPDSYPFLRQHWTLAAPAQFEMNLDAYMVSLEAIRSGNWSLGQTPQPVAVPSLRSRVAEVVPHVGAEEGAAEA